ncbi:hypothetical protein PDK26_23605 [Bacillus cereus]|nr:hypothetical protein [Bacillus cereus]
MLKQKSLKEISDKHKKMKKSIEEYISSCDIRLKDMPSYDQLSDFDKGIKIGFQHEKNSLLDLLNQVNHIICDLEKNKLILDGVILEFNDFAYEKDERFYKLIQFIELKGYQAVKQYVEVFNPCEHCEHFIERKNSICMVNPCDIWHLSIQHENEEDWLKIMEEDSDFTQEEIRIYRCQSCGKWEIDSDC